MKHDAACSPSSISDSSNNRGSLSHGNESDIAILVTSLTIKNDTPHYNITFSDSVQLKAGPIVDSYLPYSAISSTKLQFLKRNIAFVVKIHPKHLQLQNYSHCQFEK